MFILGRLDLFLNLPEVLQAMGLQPLPKPIKSLRRSTVEFT